MRNVTRVSSHDSGAETTGQCPNQDGYTKWSLSLPDAPTLDDVQAVAADISSSRRRVHEVLVPQQQALIDERRELVALRFEVGNLNWEQRLRIQLIEWKLNLIDDAILGPELDQRARYLRLKRELAGELQSFVNQMQAARPEASRPRGKRRRG